MSTVRRQPGSTASPSRSAGNGPPPTGALDRSAQIEAQVEECAEQISAITAALKVDVTPVLATTDLELALAQSELVRQKIEKCAEELHTLNTALSQEMRERRRSERALAGMQVRLIGAQIDVLEARSELTRVKDERERARYFAFHDSLTGLANRNLFSDRLEHALTHSKRYGTLLAVMCVNVDKFKAINEAHSHYVGDKVLQTMAQRLHDAVRSADTVCRTEGDQFLLLLEDVAAVDAAEFIARKVIRAIAQPFDVESLRLIVTACIGVALYPRDGKTAETLINNADSAVSVAKRGSARFAFYSPRQS
ncbi:MAG: hypothetical protein V7606_246 [Burkholderiales bacterium]|jgi:diguanylate cyclase (GGDEF)-like protein